MEKQIEQWLEAKAELNKWKAEELALRLQIVEAITGPVPGTYHKETTTGKITATVKRNYKVDYGEIKSLWNELSIIEQDCINFSASLKMREFKKINGACLLHRAVTETESTPTLVFKERSRNGT